jgi:hypothetical protein
MGNITRRWWLSCKDVDVSFMCCSHWDDGSKTLSCQSDLIWNFWNFVPKGIHDSACSLSSVFQQVGTNELRWLFLSDRWIKGQGKIRLLVMRCGWCVNVSPTVCACHSFPALHFRRMRRAQHLFICKRMPPSSNGWLITSNLVLGGAFCYAERKSDSASMPYSDSDWPWPLGPARD